MFKAFIKGELMRYVVTNSTAAGFDEMAAVFRQRLLHSGYPAAFLQPIFDSVQHSHRHSMPQVAATPAAAPTAPLLVFTNGMYEAQRINLSKVVNAVYAKHKTAQLQLTSVFGDKVVVAFINLPNPGKLLVKATH